MPADTRFTARLKGSIGVKYLEVDPGHSRRELHNGATVPVSQTGATTDLDQVLNMFSPPTRKGVQQSTIGFGEAVAGRGYDLNRAIGKFLPLVSNLLPVTTNLASPSTDLAGFLRGLESLSGALAPVAQTQASLFTNLNTTFSALAPVAPSLQDTVSSTPPAFEAVITQSPVIRPFLTDTASLLTQLNPGVQDAADERAGAHERVPHRRAEPAGDDPVRPAAGVVVEDDRRLREHARRAAGLGSLSYTAKQLQQPLAFLTPVQSTCNYVTLFLRNIARATSEHVPNGGFLDFLPMSIRDSPGGNLNYETQPSSEAVHRTGVEMTPGPASSGRCTPIRTRTPLRRVRRRECAAGNEPLQRERAADRQPARQHRRGDREDDSGRLQLRRQRARISNVAAGAIGVVVIFVVCWLVFGGPIPFSGGGFKLKAVYTSQTELHLASPVRIAGVNVGKVTGIEHIGGNSPATLVTMSITAAGLPIHADATTNIRPRLFLEGNYYVNLQPGTPQAPALSSGATLSSPHNSGPVQLDRVLSALNSNAAGQPPDAAAGPRLDAQPVPTAAQDASQDPSQRGLTAGQSLNESLKYSANAFKASAIVNQALLGERPHDLSGAVAGTEKFFSGLAADQDAAVGSGDDVQLDDACARQPPAGPVGHDRAAAGDA